MLGGLLYNLGNNLLATPARLVVGLIFLSQGIQNMDNPTSVDLMFKINDYGIEGLGADALSVLLIIAGIAAILGIFVRLIGGIMAFIIITNIFAGLTMEAVTVDTISTVKMLQDRLILAIGAMTLFFLGGGFFCLDGLIFGGVRAAVGGDDKKDNKPKE